MKTSERLDRLPPYLFAELSRKIDAKKAEGVDVISLGIGDPDTPTPDLVPDALAVAAHDPGHPPVSVQPRPLRAARRLRPLLRAPLRRPAGHRDRDHPRAGGQGVRVNVNLAFLDPGTCALAADPGYPVYTGGPLLTGADAVLMPLVPELGFVPDLDAISAEDAERARLMFLNYPNNPTGAVVPDGFFEQVVEYARANDILVVHDASYTETTFDGYISTGENLATMAPIEQLEPEPGRAGSRRSSAPADLADQLAERALGRRGRGRGLQRAPQSDLVVS